MFSGLKLNCRDFKTNKKLVLNVTVAILVLIAGFALLSVFGIQKPDQKKQPQPVNGVLDLTGWNFQTDGNVNLDGEWKFYWNNLLNPQQSGIQYAEQQAATSRVPGVWKYISANGRHLPDEGFATYRLLVKMDSIPENLAFNVRFFISACCIWVDNKKVYQAGITGKEAYEHKGGFNPQIITIHPGSNQFYITIQISNFGYANGGFIRSIELGDTLMLVNQKNIRSFGDMFLFGSIMIMGLYHLTLFLLRRKEYYTLFFSIMCFLISVRTLLMGEMLLYYFFPGVPLNVFLKLSGLTLPLGLSFFVMFIHSFFPKETPRWFVRISQAVGLFFSAITIVTSDKINSMFLPYFQISAVLIIITILIVLVKAVYFKRDASLVFLIATISITLIIINDILYSYGIIKTDYYISFGQFMFIFIQSFILFRKLVKQEEMLLKSELRMLQAQIKPHFLFNALNTIIYVSRTSSEKAVELLLNLSNYLRCGFSFKNDEEFVDFKTEILHVRSYLALETARFSEKLKVDFDIDKNIECKVPPYILQPVVENAVRHGILPRKNGGSIKLSAKQTGNTLSIVIEDDGVGMTEEKLNSILNGTDKSAGIGVLNVKNRIEKIYKRKVDIKSAVNKGTVVSITIPLTKERRRAV